ncbi:MAG TPA: universal stress protein [Burkholderiales bacterium]|nr:universal stress protein [Burkholderiales bacterium]
MRKAIPKKAQPAKPKTQQRQVLLRAAFRHILVPTDGSREAGVGVKKAIALARDLGARLRAVYLPPLPPASADIGLGALHDAPLLVEHFDQMAKAQAEKALARIQAAAEEAGVECTGETLQAREPWPALLERARALRCDLLVVAPHGRLEGGAPAGAEVSILVLA